MNSITVKNNTLEGINSRLEDAEEQISDLEDRVMESNQAEQQKGKGIKKENQLRNLATSSSVLTLILQGCQKEREKRAENLFEKITAETSIIWGKEHTSRFRKNREPLTKLTQGGPHQETK